MMKSGDDDPPPPPDPSSSSPYLSDHHNNHASPPSISLSSSSSSYRHQHHPSNTSPTFVSHPSFSETDSPEFLELMSRVNEMNFDSLEKTQAIGLGFDSNGHDTIYILPCLALANISESQAQYSILESLIYYFLKISQHIVDQPYNIVYGHMNLSFFYQFSTLLSYRRLLPKRYKKNLLKFYLLHSTTQSVLIRNCLKILFGTKIVGKIMKLSCIAELQAIISPLTLPLPPPYILWEDTVHFKRVINTMPPLIDLFDESLGAPLLMVQCLDFLQQYGGLYSEGLFRVAGDQIIYEIAKIRILKSGGTNVIICPPPRVILGGDMSLGIDSNDTSLTPPPPRLLDRVGGGGGGDGKGDEGDVGQSEDFEEFRINRQNTINSQRSIGQGIPLRDSPAIPPKLSFRQRMEGFNRKNMFPMADVLLHDVNEVAQLLKSFLRSLPEPVITTAAYQALIEASKTSLGSQEESLEVIENILSNPKLMPPAHIRTFEYLMSFLAALARESQINKMGPDNISVVFAPTLMRMEIIDPIQALQEVKISQKVLKAVLLNRMERHLSVEFASTRNSGGRMNTRLGKVVR